MPITRSSKLKKIDKIIKPYNKVFNMSKLFWKLDQLIKNNQIEKEKDKIHCPFPVYLKFIFHYWCSFGTFLFSSYIFEADMNTFMLWFSSIYEHISEHIRQTEEVEVSRNYCWWETRVKQ